jgi:hypothetical protein
MNKHEKAMFQDNFASVLKILNGLINIAPQWHVAMMEFLPILRQLETFALNKIDALMCITGEINDKYLLFCDQSTPNNVTITPFIINKCYAVLADFMNVLTIYEISMDSNVIRMCHAMAASSAILATEIKKESEQHVRQTQCPLRSLYIWRTT